MKVKCLGKVTVLWTFVIFYLHIKKRLEKKFKKETERKKKMIHPERTTSTDSQIV